MILQHFKSLTKPEQIYQHLMLLGKTLPPFDPAWKQESNLVVGCQSIMYLHTECREGRIYFAAHSDALISAGLAALLIAVYNGESAEKILTSNPTFLEELGISASLTPGRANGVASLWLKMKQDVVRFLVI